MNFRFNIYQIFIIILMGMEYYPIESLGGLRLYHLFAPLVILLLLGRLPKIITTAPSLTLLLFILVNFVAAMMAASQVSALLSLGLLVANIGIAFAVALILVSKKLTLEGMAKLSLGVALVGVLWGVLQISAFKLTGLNLGLSDSQQLQIQGGFSSGFRWEANAFAKNLNVVFLLSLPWLLSLKRRRTFLLITGLLLVGMLTSLTRSALYGLSLTLVFAYLWYLRSGRGRPLTSNALLFLGLMAVSFGIFVLVASFFNDYAAHKLAFFFDSGEILHGESSEFRLMSQGLLWDAFLTNGKTMLIGNGWGQVKYYLGDQLMQAGGAEIVVALGYGGILGGLAYLGYFFSALRTVRKALRRARGSIAPWIEGLYLALIGCFITGFLNGSMIAPEYWMLFGMAMACPYLASSGEGASTEGALQEGATP